MSSASWSIPPTHSADFTPCDGDDRDSLAVEQVEELVAKGFLLKFPDLEACRSYLGAAPVVSKFLIVTKTRRG